MSERPKPFRSLQLPTHFGVHFCTHHVLALVSTRRCVVFCTHLCTFSTQSFLESNVTLTNRRFGYGNQLANKVCLEIDPFCLKKKESPTPCTWLTFLRSCAEFEYLAADLSHLNVSLRPILKNNWKFIEIASGIPAGRARYKPSANRFTWALGVASCPQWSGSAVTSRRHCRPERRRWRACRSSLVSLPDGRRVPSTCGPSKRPVYRPGIWVPSAYPHRSVPQFWTKRNSIHPHRRSARPCTKSFPQIPSKFCWIFFYKI